MKTKRVLVAWFVTLFVTLITIGKPKINVNSSTILSIGAIIVPHEKSA